MSLKYRRALGAALINVVLGGGLDLSAESATAQTGSYAQTGAFQFSPFANDYIKDPASPDFLNPFIAAGNSEFTESFANASLIDEGPPLDVDAWAMGDAYGEITAAALLKSVEANKGYKKNGNFFAFAQSTVRGTTFQVQGATCNDFNEDGQCDVRVLIEIPSTAEAPDLRATQLEKAPDANILLPERQQLVADDPFNLLRVAGCEFFTDPNAMAACEANGVAQAFDLSLRVDGIVEVPAAGIQESVSGQVTLSGNGELTYETTLGNIFLGNDNVSGRDVFGDVVTDPATGRSSATVAERVIVREYFINTDDNFLSGPITIDLAMTLNGPPLPGIPAADLDPDQPIDDFFDPFASPLDIPYYVVIGIDESDTERVRGAAGDFNLLVTVEGGTIVPEPSAVHLILCGLLAIVCRRRRG